MGHHMTNHTPTYLEIESFSQKDVSRLPKPRGLYDHHIMPQPSPHEQVSDYKLRLRMSLPHARISSILAHGRNSRSQASLVWSWVRSPPMGPPPPPPPRERDSTPLRRAGLPSRRPAVRGFLPSLESRHRSRSGRQ